MRQCLWALIQHAITVSAAAGVHAFVLSFYVLFMSACSFRRTKRRSYIRVWVSRLPCGSMWFRSLEVEVNSRTPLRTPPTPSVGVVRGPLSDSLTESRGAYVKLLQTACQYFPRAGGSGGGAARVIRSGAANESRQLVSAEAARQTPTAPPRRAGHPRVARVLQSPPIIRECAQLSGGLHERR